MTYTVTDQDLDSAYKALRHRSPGSLPMAADVFREARALAEARWRSEKPTEPGLPPVVLESERITAQDLGPIVLEEDNV